jgi:hypothetical protein
MTLPDKDHPIWKLAQMVLSIIILAMVAKHGLNDISGHALDLTDVIGGGVASKFILELLHAKKENQ